MSTENNIKTFWKVSYIIAAELDCYLSKEKVCAQINNSDLNCSKAKESPYVPRFKMSAFLND